MSGTVDFLPWDSEFFGTRIGRVRVDKATDVETAAAACDAHGLACAYLLVDATHADTISASQRVGFRVVDIRVTLDRRIGASDAAVEPQERPAPIRPALTDDLATLQAIARTAFSDTRFYRDGRFAPQRCADLYDTWITKACGGQAGTVLVSDGTAGASGFVTCTALTPDIAQIGLIAVDGSARGTKTGGRLVDAAVRWAAREGCGRVEVVTQGSNIAAMRTYEATGFRVCRSEIWLHRWADEVVGSMR